MYMVGDVAIAGRNSQFEIRYDLPERVIPREHLEAPTPTERRRGQGAGPSRRALTRRRAPLRDLADYYRLRSSRTEPDRCRRPDAIDELVEEGELIPVTVEGVKRPSYLHRDARIPRRVGPAPC